MSQSTSARVVGLVTTNSPAFVKRTLELMREGAICVPLRTADDERIGLAGVTEVEAPAGGHGWFAPESSAVHGDAVVQIAFTSGTEGAPKGVYLTGAALADVVQRLNDVMGVDSTIREYVGVPVYHSFGFGRCRAIAAVGGRAYIPPDGFNPLELLELLKAGEINAISAVPSLWRALLEDREAFVGPGESVKWIEIGSQYMSRAEKEALKELFPKAVIVQHYGLTEASRSTFLRIHDTSGHALESVGKPTGEVEVRISDEGRVQIRGPHVARTVLLDAKASESVDADGWYTTSDRGSLKDGYLFYEGRADDLINCGGLKVSPERLELAVRKRTGIQGDFAICRVPDRMRGDGILMVWTKELADQAQTLAAALVEEAASYGMSVRGALRGGLVTSIPRTASGKVQRQELAKQNENLPALTVGGTPLASAGPEGTPQTERERELLVIWQQALGVTQLRVDESFYDLGGDSVTALSVVVRMSRAGIDVATCRRIFQGATIREIASGAGAGAANAAGGTAPTESPAAHREYLNTLVVNALRGIIVLAVVTGHWSQGALERLHLTELAPLFAPYFSFGTPGFAIVFGVGYGYLYLDRQKTNPDRVWAAMRLGTMMITGGVLLLALLRMGVSERPLAYASAFEHFYSALTFYALALPTMPLWGRLLHRFPTSKQVFGAAVLGLGSYLVSRGFSFLLSDVRADGFLRLGRLMLVAKYNYFAMAAGVLAGVGAGVFLRREGDQASTPRVLLLAGLSILGVSLALAASIGELSLLVQWPSPLKGWKWLSYLGAVLILLSGLLALSRNYNQRPIRLRKATEGLATIGQLALPFYIFHEMVIPMKALVMRFGAGDLAAVLIVMVLFFGTAVWMVRRVQSLFHAA